MNDKPTASNGLMHALLAVQQSAPKLSKDATNPHFRSKYVSLDSLMAAITPVLVDHGLVWTTLPGYDEQGSPTLTYRLIHAETGEALEGTMPLMLAKPDSQGQGSALTYARRYSISAVLGLVADEDDDGARATQKASTDALPQLTTSDVAELKAAAKGLKVAQIKMALTSVGLSHPANGGELFGTVPKQKLPLLVECLAGIERES